MRAAKPDVLHRKSLERRRGLSFRFSVVLCDLCGELGNLGGADGFCSTTEITERHRGMRF